MSREYPQMRLRMSPELKQDIEEAAQENGRSMNAEIVQRLEASFGHTPNTDDMKLGSSFTLGAITGFLMQNNTLTMDNLPEFNTLVEDAINRYYEAK